MADPKDLAKRLKKNAMKRAMKYLSTPEGMETFNKVLDAKKRADRTLAGLYGLAGLPSLRDKHQVEWAVDRQTRRVREINTELAKIERLLDHLERAAATPSPDPQPIPAPEPVVAPAPLPEPPAPPAPTAVAKKPAPKKAVAKKSMVKKPAAKKPVAKKSAPAKAKKPAPKKPIAKAKKPAPSRAAAPAKSGKALLELDFRRKGKR